MEKCIGTIKIKLRYVCDMNINGYKLKYKCALSGHHVWLKYNNSGHIRDLCGP